MSTQLNGSVMRAFEILDLLNGQRTEINAAAVSAELGVNSVTAHRFLKTLEAVGALASPARGVYRLGYRLVDLAGRVRHHQELADALQPALDRLTQTTQESSFASVLEGDAVVVIARTTARQTLSVDVRVGVPLETHATAHGKVWLASLDETALRRHLTAVTLTRFTPATITGHAALRAVLATVRARGYATNDGEREAGIRAVAVPLTARDGRLIASISVFGPQARMGEAVLATCLARLRQAVDEARAALYGGTPAAMSSAAGGTRPFAGTPGRDTKAR